MLGSTGMRLEPLGCGQIPEPLLLSTYRGVGSSSLMACILLEPPPPPPLSLCARADWLFLTGGTRPRLTGEGTCNQGEPCHLRMPNPSHPPCLQQQEEGGQQQLDGPEQRRRSSTGAEGLGRDSLLGSRDSPELEPVPPDNSDWERQVGLTRTPACLRAAPCSLCDCAPA